MNTNSPTPGHRPNPSKSNRRRFFCAVALLLAWVAAATASERNPQTDWFHEAQYGLLFHYLYPADAGQKFDVERFADQVAETGAGYVMFTLGQNSGHYCSPNATYDRYAGYAPGERCSTRDLPLELARALARKGIRLMLYLPSNAPADDAPAARGLGVTTKKGDRYNWDITPELKSRWSEVIQEWSDRYGTNVAGWWFDGWFRENNFTDPFAESYAKAVKHGNPNALVCFNRNVEYGIRKSTDFEDYTAGERNEFTETPAGRWKDDIQWHVISFMGPGWAQKGCKYSDEYMADYVTKCARAGGVVTIDMAIARDGSLDPRQIDQMKAIRKAVRARDTASAPHRADWMQQYPFGLMVHWIAPGPAPLAGRHLRDLNAAVNAFDLDRFMADFERTGAGWLIFTIGQNSTVYASPNPVMDRLVGPGHCSGRDLVGEIAQRIHALGKRFIGYLPAEINAPEKLHEGFAWNPKDQSEFQRRYTDFIRAYSVRFGPLLDGWWFDGCYTWEAFPNSTYNWPLWFDAARAGNTNAIVAFNDGSFCVGNTNPVTTLQDFLSGEIELLQDSQIRLGRDTNAPLYLPTGRFAPGNRTQWHALAPIDCNRSWSHEKAGPLAPPSYPDEELLSFLKNCRKVGGVVTFNVGISQEGRLGEQTVNQLHRLAVSLNPP